MARFDETPVLDVGRTPVDPAQPAGVDAAEDEQYIAVMAEMAKLDRIEADPPDWFVVEQSCLNLLRAKSKDLEIAVALGHALFKRNSYAGLSAALGMLTELVSQFWDGLFPERPRRRKARVESLADRFTDKGWFGENQPKPDDFDALDACVQRAQSLKAAFAAKLPDESLEFDKFLKGLSQHAGKRPKPGVTAASPSAGPAGQPSGPGLGVGEVTDGSAAINAILTGVTFLRKADSADPTPYAVVRAVKWSKISLPTSDAGKFQIEPPEASLVDTLTHQFQGAIWENLLRNAEAAFRSNDPLWLDLQRYVCSAMSGLGPTFEKARHAVTGLTGALVRRLGTGVFELKFRSGTPLCSGETRLWIESEAAPPTGGGNPRGVSSDGKLEEATDKARKLAGTGKLKEALQELQAGLTSTSQRRDRLLWRLRIAQLCCDAQKLQLASSLLEECYDDVRRYHIDEWESSLAVEVAQNLYRCRKALSILDKTPTPEMLQRVREAFAWLCQLDPLAALTAEPAGP